MKIFGLLDTKYSRFVNSVKSSLSETLSNYTEKYGNATIFGQMINVLSAAVQNIMLYIEDALVEQNKYTAQRKKSIYGLASLSGYNPYLGKASSVQLSINIVPNNSESTNIVINNHEKLTCTQNGLTYNVILPQEAIVMKIEDVDRVVQAVQGRFEKQTFVVTGGKYYSINIQYNGNLDEDYVNVWVNNELWERSSFYDMGPDACQYTFKSVYSGGLDLMFGNDVHGRALSNNDIVTVEYLVHDGFDGNLNTQENTFFIFNDSLKDINGEDVDGNSIFNVSFANHDSVTSGTDSESKEQVRQMIGANSRSLVLAAPAHYKQFINRFSFCGYNRTWSEKGSMIVNSLIMKNIKLNIKNGSDYFDLNLNDFLLSDSQKKSILNSIELSGYQLGGVSYNIIDPILRRYALYVYIKMKNQKQDKEFIKNQIKTLVGNFFAYIQSDIFIPKSDIINLIKNEVSGVDSVDVYFLSERNEEAMIVGSYVNNTYTWNVSKGIYDIKTENVYLYEGQNPGLGLDNHGNILLEANYEFPVIGGGWRYETKDEIGAPQLVMVEPITITIE